MRHILIRTKFEQLKSYLDGKSNPIVPPSHSGTDLGDDIKYDQHKQRTERIAAYGN